LCVIIVILLFGVHLGIIVFNTKIQCNASSIILYTINNNSNEIYYDTYVDILHWFQAEQMCLMYVDN